MLNLFLHPVGGGPNIAALYRRAFAEARELYVLSAYLMTWDTTLSIGKSCKVFSFIIGSDFGITRKQACRDVLKWLPSEMKPFFFVADEIAGFHPKGLFWKDGNGGNFSVVGSSNLSGAGWNTNYEANVFDKLSNPEFERVKTWVNGILEHSLPISKEWIDSYEESKRGPIGRRRARGSTPIPLAVIKLPTFRGQAAVIRERRNKRKRFAEIRPKMLSAIRNCASGRLSNTKFYDRLDATWGSHASRVQGWGWHVTGQKSDFTTLCRGIVAILDASNGERDHVVVRVIDDLKKQGVQTRRALLSEMLCLFFPARYPILNSPVATYVRPYVKAPRGSTEGAKYLHLALSLRAALQSRTTYPARNLLELDGMIWEFEDRRRRPKPGRR